MACFYLKQYQYSLFKLSLYHVTFLGFSYSKMLKLCGDTEDKLAQELIVFELQMERDVVDPLYVLAEVNLSLSQYNMKPN